MDGLSIVKGIRYVASRLSVKITGVSREMKGYRMPGILLQAGLLEYMCGVNVMRDNVVIPAIRSYRTSVELHER